MREEGLLEAGLEEGAERALEVHHVEAVRDRDRVAPVCHSPNYLVQVVGNEEQRGLPQQVAPSTGQSAPGTVDEAGHELRNCNQAVSIWLAAYPRRMTWKRPPRRRVRAIRDRLRELYGRPADKPHGHPIAELIRTVLSQNTSDTNRDVAYGRLRDRFPTWEDVRDAPVADVIEAIRPGGLANTKAPRIQTILRQLDDHPDLDWLADVPRSDAIDYLTSLPGVGRKTAACVLLFALGRPEIPVDTHVYRVGGRLGLLREGSSFDEAHDEMLRIGGSRGRIRVAHQPDPPRASGVPPAAPMRRVRPPAHVPLLASAEVDHDLTLDRAPPSRSSRR